MPIQYKLPAYVGNALLAAIGLVVMATNSFLLGVSFAGLAGLNLFLIRKLDLFSREEGLLALELKKAKMREELLAIQSRLEDENRGAAPE